MSDHAEQISELKRLVDAMQADAERRDAQMQELRAETARLSTLVDAADATPHRPGPAAPVPDARSSRRTMFKVGAGAAVAAAAVVAPNLANTAAAADGGNFVIGANNTSDGGHTRLNSTGAGLLSNQNILTVSDQNSSSQYEAAIGAYGEGDRVTNGVYAYAGSRTVGTATGHAIVAVATSAARSHLLLPSRGFDPNTDTYAHVRGSFRHTSGRLWFCTDSGTPGVWKDLANGVGADEDNTTTAETRITSSGFGPLVEQNALTVTDRVEASPFPAAVGAYGFGDRMSNGLHAITAGRDDAVTNTGHGVVVESRAGSRSHIFLDPTDQTDPNDDLYEHRRGEIRHENGTLWFCTADGNPGTWRNLTADVPAPPTPTSPVTAVSPRRVYDSRFVDGPLTGGSSRLVSVANSIDVETGAATGTLVPSGATAVFFNITAISTVNRGFLAAAPGDATEFEASSVNWTASGQNIANGTLSSVDGSLQLRVFCGNGSAQFAVDITGYIT